jgi:BirA family transcriptional regulator, biotin operon repressor / biotin---[acetyl-CoA-carboxylase] ligase
MTSTGWSTRCWPMRRSSAPEMSEDPQMGRRGANGPQTSHLERATTTPRSHTNSLGDPHLHLRRTTSTNDRARALALAGAPHGTLVTADEQTAGRGRQGRRWTAPAGSALLMSLVLRKAPEPLSLLAGIAVCEAVGEKARVKWPNDIVVEDGSEDGPALKKLAGILVESRPQEGWAVLGIGVNVAVRIDDMPEELRGTAATLGLEAAEIDSVLASLLAALGRRLAAPADQTLEAWRALDALRGREVSWGESGGDAQETNERPRGRAAGIDGTGRLIVIQPNGQRLTLDAGEVHLRDVRR